VEGKQGEFTVWVDGRKVADKGLLGIPTDRTIVNAVRDALIS
jgi:hypothetical protein